MRIKGKCYCDVCLKELENTCETCFIISGANLDDRYEEQERHYCKEHRTWYELWYAIRNGKNIGQLTFPNKTKEKETEEEKENKEVSVLELYDILSGFLKKNYNYLSDMIIPDKDLRDYYKQVLDADITYNRMKVRGEIKTKEKENKKC